MLHDRNIRLLGRFVARARTVEVRDFKTIHARNLLVYLAMHPDIDHPRDRLVQAIWPGKNDGSARNRLSVTLYHMKRALAEHDNEFAEAVQPGRSTIRLDSSNIFIDLHAFRGEIARARKADTAEQKRKKYASAMDLYTGPLTPDIVTEWSLARQIEASQMFQEAAIWLARDLSEQGDLDGAEAVLSSALDTEPYSERATELLTNWLCETGRYEVAIACAKRLRRSLASIGQPPSPAIVQRIHELNEIVAARSQGIVFADESVVTLLTIPGIDRREFEALVSEFGGRVSSDGCHGLFSNPLVAMEAGLAAQRQDPTISGLIHSTIMGQNDPAPPVAQGHIAVNEPRGLYSTDAFAHLVRERHNDTVRRVAASEKGWMIV